MRKIVKKVVLSAVIAFSFAAIVGTESHTMEIPHSEVSAEEKKVFQELVEELSKLVPKQEESACMATWNHMYLTLGSGVLNLADCINSKAVKSLLPKVGELSSLKMLRICDENLASCQGVCQTSCTEINWDEYYDVLQCPKLIHMIIHGKNSLHWFNEEDLKKQLNELNAKKAQQK